MAINAGTILAYLSMDSSGFTSAMNTAQGQLSSFADEGGGVSGMLDSVGASMTTLGTALTTTVTAPLLTVGIAAVTTGLKFDESMSNVAALSGTTGEKFDQLRAKALEMGSETKYTASQAADAMGYMALAGWNADQMMAGLPGVLNLAAASNMDLARASDIVTDTMTPFGLAAAEATRVSDVFAKAQATSNTTVEMLGEAMKYAASNADAFGMDIEQTTAVMGLFANSGLKGSMAGTTLVAMLNDMKNSMENGAITIGKTSVQLTDASGDYLEFADIIGQIETATAGMSESERDAALSAVFQTRGLKGVLALLKQGSGTLEDYTDELYAADGAAEDMATTMQDNLKGDLTILKSAIEGAAISLSDYLSPALRKATQWLTNAVSWWNGLDSGIRNVIYRIGVIAAAIGPALMIGGKLITAFSGVIPVLTLVGGGFALIYKHSERLQSIVGSLKTKGLAAFDGLKNGVAAYRAQIAAGVRVTDALKTAINTAFGEKSSGMINGIIGKITGAIGKAGTAVRGTANFIGEFIGSLIDGQGAAASLEDALQSAFSGNVPDRIRDIQSGIAGFVAEIKTNFEEGGIPAVLKGLGGRMATAMRAGWAAVKTGAATLRDKIADGLSMAKDWLEPKARQWMANLGDAYQNAKEYVIEKLPAVKEAIANGLQVAKGTLISGAKTAMKWLGDAYRSGTVQKKLGKLKEVGEAIYDKFTDGKNWLTDKAGDLLTSLGEALGSDAVQEKIGDLSSIAATIATKILSGAGSWKITAAKLIGGLVTQLTDNDFLQTALEGIGEVVIGIAEGLGNAASNIASAADDIITTLIGDLTKPGVIEGAFSAAGDVIIAIANVLGDAAGNIIGAASDIAVALINGIASVDWATVFDTAGDVIMAIAGVLGGVASNIATAAGDIATALINGIAAIDWVTVFDKAGDVITSIAGVLGGVASNIVSAASDIAVALINGITAIDWVTVFDKAGDVIISIAGVLGGVANNIATAAGDIATALINGIMGIDWATIFDKAGDVITAIAGVLSGVAGNIVGTATDIATALINGLATVDWGSIFTTAGDVVASIGGVLADNADKIVSAALDLGLSLLDGLADLDWAGISNSLAIACGKLVEALAEWFSDPENLDQLKKIGVSIADGIMTGLSQGASGISLIANDKLSDAFDRSPMANTTKANYFGEEWAYNWMSAFSSGITDGTLSQQQQLAIAVALIGQGYSDEIDGIAPDVYDSAQSIFRGLYDAVSVGNVISAFGRIGYNITDALATAISNNQLTAEDAVRALGAGMSESMILSMSQLELREYLNKYFTDTGTEVGALLQSSATDWGKIFGQAIPDGATVGLENGMYTLRNKTGEVIALVSAVDAESAVKTGNEDTAQAGIDAASSTLTAGETDVGTAAQGVVDAATTPFEDLPVDTQAQAAAMMVGINSAIAAGTPEATATVQTAAQAVADKAAEILNGETGATVGKDYAGGIGSGILSKRGSLVSDAQSVGRSGAAAARLEMTAGIGYSIGVNMVQGIINGVGSMGGALTNKMRSLASAAVAAFRNQLQMHSPSVILTADGAMIPTSIAMGIEKNEDEAVRSMTRMARDMQRAWPGIEVDGANVTNNSSKSGGLGGGSEGISFNFYGDITVREEADIQKVSAAIAEEIKDEIRGRGL